MCSGPLACGSLPEVHHRFARWFKRTNEFRDKPTSNKGGSHGGGCVCDVGAGGPLQSLVTSVSWHQAQDTKTTTQQPEERTKKHQTKNKPGFCALPCVSTLPYSHPGMSVWSLALSVRTSLTCLILFVYFRYWLEEALTQHPCDPLRLPTKVTQDGQLVWCPWARLFALPFWMAWPLSWTVL